MAERGSADIRRGDTLLEHVRSNYVLYDVTRLVRRANETAPTGIDRLDAHFAMELLKDRRQRFLPVIRFVNRPVVLPTGQFRKFLDSLTHAWGGGQTREVDIKDATDWRKTIVEALSGRGLKRLREAAAAGEVTYVCCSHSGLPLVGGLLSRLGKRFGVTSLIYVHDIIPVDFPEYVKTGTVERVHRFFSNVVSAKASMVANSEYTSRRLTAWLREKFGYELPALPPVVVPRPTWLDLRNGGKVSAETADLIRRLPCYFMILGTIEPRKNHLLLLNIWRKWALEGRNPIPHLLVIGKRGWENENVVDMLERCRAIRHRVHELGMLPQADVLALMRNTCALLMPTFAEGLGLPALEAERLGTPVIASDIPVFREFLGGSRHTTLLDPIDGPGWAEAILATMRARRRKTAAGAHP